MTKNELNGSKQFDVNDIISIGLRIGTPRACINIENFIEYTSETMQATLKSNINDCKNWNLNLDVSFLLFDIDKITKYVYGISEKDFQLLATRSLTFPYENEQTSNENPVSNISINESTDIFSYEKTETTTIPVLSISDKNAVDEYIISEPIDISNSIKNNGQTDIPEILSKKPSKRKANNIEIYSGKSFINEKNPYCSIDQMTVGKLLENFVVNCRKLYRREKTLKIGVEGELICSDPKLLQIILEICI